MLGFAVYYRYPNSQRVTYAQFIRVAKIKGDEREDLKVLATGVAAALASGKSSWVTEEEFGKGYIDLKLAPSPSIESSAVTVSTGSAPNVSQHEAVGTRNINTGIQVTEAGTADKDQMLRPKSVDGRLEKTENITSVKSDLGHSKQKLSSSTNGLDTQSVVPSSAVQSGTSRPEIQKNADETVKGILDESAAKVAPESGESKLTMPGEYRACLIKMSRPSVRRSVAAGSLSKAKQEVMKEDTKPGKSVRRAGGSTSNEKEFSSHPADGRQSTAANISAAVANGNTMPTSTKTAAATARTMDAHINSEKLESGVEHRFSAGKDIDDPEVGELQRSLTSRPPHSPVLDDSAGVSKITEKQLIRSSPVEEQDKLNKRRKGESDVKDGEGEAQFSDRERSVDLRLSHSDHEKVSTDESSLNRNLEKVLDRLKDKSSERHEKDHRDRLESPDKSSGEDIIVEKFKDRSLERYGRERSLERGQERGTDRSSDRGIDKSKEDINKDDRVKSRYIEASVEKGQAEERFHRQSLPPPTPLSPDVFPQSVNPGRREEDADRRVSSVRHVQRLSPRHEDKERRRSEENSTTSQEDTKRKREDDFKDRKREERDSPVNEGGKRVNFLKEDMDVVAASKRPRKLKRDHVSSEGGDYSSTVPLPLSRGMAQSYDGRDGDRKPLVQRVGYDDPMLRMHAKETGSKNPRRDSDPMYEREWEDQKRQRAEQKRRHSRK